MICPDPGYLMFVEPKDSPNEFIDDELTQLAMEVWNGCKPIAVSYRGFHTCSCGVQSTNRNYVTKGGNVTNSLLIHYVARHREEIPEEEIDKLLLEKEQ
jgi:hypothetical protein